MTDPLETDALRDLGVTLGADHSYTRPCTCWKADVL